MIAAVLTCSALVGQSAEYEAAKDYPLMGDWVGRWVNAERGHEKHHPTMGAQLLPEGNRYRVVITPGLYMRANPYVDVIVPGTHKRVEVKQNGFHVVFMGETATGKASLHGRPTEFTLTKQAFTPPTVGMAPPVGATVLFDGTDFTAWRHADGRAVTWRIVGDAMQVVTRHDKENKRKRLGGDIRTKKTFGSMRFHMEFRYPVEANKTGQERGNSGLFFFPIGEVQILNSYTTFGYWDEAGSIYKRVPAKVNAAGPPLAWQTYDVTLGLPKKRGDKAIITVLLNGKILHNKMEIECGSHEVAIGLQDHINPIQFRNIWLLEEK